MPLSTLIRTALGSLVANKLRSFLAMLGIIIGVMSVITMLALGAGAQQQVMARFTQMGNNLLFVRPGQRGFGGVNTGLKQDLTVKDARALLKEVPELVQVSPVARGNAQVKYLENNQRTTVMGVAVTYFPMRAFELEEGRFFTEQEVEGQSPVAVVGSEVALQLFGAASPVNHSLKVNGLNFRVVGLLKSKGDQGWSNPDDMVAVPYTTAMNRLFGLDNADEITLQVAEGADAFMVTEKAAAVLRRLHRIGEGEEDDFNVRNMTEIIEATSAATKTFSMLLGGIAGISLVVGGIGIMNIMLVSVTERTREIGIRKAIGAKDRDVLAQFLIEAMVMSASGGLLGAGGALALSRLGEKFAGYPMVVQPGSMALALGFSCGVGVVFGFYPAWRASLMNPIEALRYE